MRPNGYSSPLLSTTVLRFFTDFGLFLVEDGYSIVGDDIDCLNNDFYLLEELVGGLS